MLTPTRSTRYHSKHTIPPNIKQRCIRLGEEKTASHPLRVQGLASTAGHFESKTKTGLKTPRPLRGRRRGERPTRFGNNMVVFFSSSRHRVRVHRTSLFYRTHHDRLPALDEIRDAPAVCRTYRIESEPYKKIAPFFLFSRPRVERDIVSQSTGTNSLEIKMDDVS